MFVLIGTFKSRKYQDSMATDSLMVAREVHRVMRSWELHRGGFDILALVTYSC